MKSVYTTLVFVLVVPIFSGCILKFDESFCNIEGYEIIDNSGRIGVKIHFHSTGNMTFQSTDPSGKEIDKIFTPYTIGDIILNISFYHENPSYDRCKILVYDAFGNKVNEFTVNLHKAFINMENAKVLWWKEKRNSFSIVEIRLLVRNCGDIPIYVDKALVKIESRFLEVKTLENVLQPGQANITLSLFIDSLKKKTHNLSITLVDINNNTLASSNFFISPETNLNMSYFSETWRFGRKTYSLTIPIPEGLYEYCSNLPRLYLEDYSFYAIDPKTQGFVEMLSKKLESMYSGKDLINFIASFVQNIEYQREEGEYPKYPVELLHDGFGDCEDKAILASSILYRLGFDVCLIRFEDHMAVGIHLEDYDGKVYYVDDYGKPYIYLETSNVGWKLGEADKDYSNAENYTIYHVKDKPILVQVCRAPVRHILGSMDYIDLRSTIINLGSEDAKNVKIRVKIEIDGSENIVSESKSICIREGEGKDIYLKFETPDAPFSKVFVIIVHDDKEVARSSFIFRE